MKISRAGRLIFGGFVLLMGACAAPDLQIGHQYLGARYLGDPLGEGAGYDPDPVIRFDAFDCVTFVETAMARGNADKLTAIRYDGGRVDFAARNHFIETDWLRHNAGRVENISRRFGPTATRTVTIDRAAWMQRMHGITIDTVPETVELEYLPYGTLPADIRPARPMIALFVIDGVGMSDKIGTDLAIVHMGFLMPDGVLRHASSQYGRVMDVNFDEYVAVRKKSRHNLGVILLDMK